MKTAVTFGLFFVLTMTNGGAQRGADLLSLGAKLVAAVQKGEVAQTNILLREWKATGCPWPNGPDHKPLLFLAIEGREKTHPKIVELFLANGARVLAWRPAAAHPVGRTAGGERQAMARHARR